MLSHPQVLIVGSGPTGLVAAIALLKNGINVRIIEKSTDERIGQRGAGVMPRTLEVYESLGLLDEAMEQSTNVPMSRLYKPGSATEVLKEFQIAPYVEPTPDRPYLTGRFLGQEQLDRILRAVLSKFNVQVEFGIELISFTQDADKVGVKLQKASGEQEEGSYEYMIGADGAKSVVRKQLGLTFHGETTEQKMAVGDLFVEGLEDDKWHIWGDRNDYFTTMQPTGRPGLFSFVTGGPSLSDPADILESEDALKEYMKARLHHREDIKFGAVRWMGAFTINVRMVETYNQGRIIIAEDAAHVHSPTGAQGLNTGIQDAYNLSWKLALVLKNLAPPSLLQTVSEERIPVVAEMLNLTTAVMKKVLNSSTETRPEAVNQLGVNYRASSIVRDEGSGVEEAKKVSPYGGAGRGVVFAGDRAPDAPGLIGGGSSEPTRLFKILNPTRHTILVFTDKPGESNIDISDSNPILSKYPVDLVRFVVINKQGSGIRPGQPQKSSVEVFKDTEGHAYSAYRD